MLNISALKTSLLVSNKGKFLVALKSRFLYEGSCRSFRLSFPRVNAAGCSNAAGFSHCFRLVPPPPLDIYGFAPALWALWLPHPVFATSPFAKAFVRAPESRVTILPTLHPPRTLSVEALAPLRNRLPFPTGS